MVLAEASRTVLYGMVGVEQLRRKRLPAEQGEAVQGAEEMCPHKAGRAAAVFNVSLLCRDTYSNNLI